MKVSHLQLVRANVFVPGIGELKRTLSQATYPGISMTKVAEGVRISHKNVSYFIPNAVIEVAVFEVEKSGKAAKEEAA